MVIRKAALALAVGALLFSGCEVQKPSKSGDNKTPKPKPVASPLFQPLAQDAAFLPFPTDLLFNGTNDGNLNLPVVNAAENGVRPPLDPATAEGALAYSDPMVALNTMSGFSTTAMMTIPFSVSLDAEQDLSAGIHIFKTQNKDGGNANFILKSVGDTVIAQVNSGISAFGLECNDGFVALDVTTLGLPPEQEAALQGAQADCADGLGAVASGTPDVADQLRYGVDYIANVSDKTVAIMPLRPLESATSYIVVVSDAVKAANGESVQPDSQYVDARAGTISPLGGKTGALYQQIAVSEGLAALATAGDIVPGDGGNIALSYTVTTQNTLAPILQAQVATATEALTAAAIAQANPTPENMAALLSVAVSPLDAANNAAVAGGLGLTADLGAGEEALVQVYAGKVSNMSSFLDPADPVHSLWNNNGDNLSVANKFQPTPNSKVDVPVLVIAPTAAGDIAFSCAEHSLVIFQHGITSNRGTLLALAPALTKICAVGVAIDLPGHGILAADTLAGLPIGNLAAGFDSGFGVSERLVEAGAGAGGACMQSAKAAAADGRQTCASGDSFVNLTNLANARDTLRQAVVDLNSLYLGLQMTAKNIADATPFGPGLAVMDTSQNIVGAVTFNPTKISFVGMSLGAIVGGTFAATIENLQAVVAQGSQGQVMLPPLSTVTLNVGGAGIAKLLDGSPAFEPVITAGLAAQGVTKPSATYESFLIAAQTLVDSADPINYVNVNYKALNPGLQEDAGLNALTTPILFQEVVGGAAGAPDLVVPNNVFGNSPLAQAWGLVSGSGQAGALAGQNPVTNPAALGGTDSLVQGTAFVSTAAGVEADTIPPTALAAGPLFDAGVNAFFGIGLDTMTDPDSDDTGSKLVRFLQGEHSSLLDPSSAVLTTAVMQTQIAKFIASTGALVASQVDVDAVDACKNLARKGAIAQGLDPTDPAQLAQIEGIADSMCSQEVIATW